MSRTGPDGAVWIVDMYRYMIEHPDWLPPEGKEELRPQYRSGENNGRIYRVYPTDDKPRSFPRLDQMTPRELVDVLTRGNGVLRDMAARMLVGMRDISVVPMLVRLSTEHDNPRTRLHALCVLDGLESLTAGTLKAALDDKHPAVRRHAIRLTEKSTPPDLLTSLIQRVDDSSASVRLQLACTLGAWPDERAGLALAELATRTDGDHFMNSAIISSAIVHYEALVDRAMRGHVDEQIVAALLTMGTEFRRPFARLLDHYLTRLERAPGEDDFERVDSWLRTLNERRVTIDALRQSNDELSRALNRLTNVFETAMNVAGDVRRAETLRTASIRSLGHHRSQHTIQFLSELLGPQHAPAIQLAAVGALGTTRQEQAARTLLTRWGELSPAVREAAIDQLLSRESWCQLLVEAIGKGVVKSVDIDLVRRERLLKYPKKSIVSRALQLLGDETNQDREDVVTQYQSVLHLTGDAKQGEKLFGKHCATCHESDGDRPAIGADLRAITDRSAASLLRSILAPSQSVEPRYLGYNVVLQSGETVFGMVAAEAGNSLQLRMLDGKSRLVLRDDIESLQSSRLSIMPNGLETQLNRQQLADVIRFVQTLHESDDPPD